MTTFTLAKVQSECNLGSSFFSLQNPTILISICGRYACNQISRSTGKIKEVKYFIKISSVWCFDIKTIPVYDSRSYVYLIGTNVHAAICESRRSKGLAN